MPAASSWHPERYRPLLRLHARNLSLSPQLLRRFDESDLVNETMLRAQTGLANFRGSTEAEFVAWLQAAMANVLKDFARREKAVKRDVRREQYLDAAVGESSIRINRFLAVRVESPSAAMRRDETICQVTSAIDRLETDQRDAIILREIDGLPIAEIAARMKRTEKSVAGLLLRGRQRMRELLTELEEGKSQ